MGWSSTIEIEGTNNDDVIVGGDKRERIYGRDGDDLIFGGDGNDDLIGGEGNDVLYGGTGNDYLIGGQGNDELRGGNGNDVLIGDWGHNTLYGGAGDDVFLFQTIGTGHSAHIMDFEAGADEIEIRFLPTLMGEDLRDAFASRITITNDGAVINLDGIDEYAYGMSNANAPTIYVENVTDADEVLDAMTFYGMTIEQYNTAYF